MQDVKNFDCRGALETLVTRQPEVAQDTFVVRILHEGYNDEGEIISAIQKLLLNPQLTVVTAGCFRPVLSRLVDSLVQSLRHLWRQGGLSSQLKLVTTDSSAGNAPFSQWNLSVHEHAVMAFSRLLELAPYTFSIVVQYFSFAPPPFERLLMAACSLPQDLPPLLDVVRACYRFLQLEPKAFRDLWDWSPFLDLLLWDAKDPAGELSSEVLLDVRWCAAQVLSTVLRMSDGATRLMSLNISGLSEEDAFACLIRWEASGHEIALEKASMYIEPHSKDSAMITSVYKELVPSKDGFAGLDEPQSIVKRTGGAGSSFVQICGIELPVRSNPSFSRRGDSSIHSVVLTPTVKTNLESAVLALSQRQPVLLEGPIGAGKTMLIQELANLTGNSDVVFIHLDDQMDSKTLLGNYVCTDIPGEFRWQPGALTQAVVRGMWVAFEDIDRAPLEILSALTPLLEDRKLYIAGRGEVIQAAENFCLFSTVTRTKFASTIGGGKDILTNLWRKVVIDAPCDEELAVIVKVRFPTISALVPKLIGTLNMVKEMTSQSSVLSDGLGPISVHIGRQFSTRDLVKWCRRITTDGSEHYEGNFLSAHARERIFVEAVDCFAGSISSIADRQLVLRAIAEQWEIPSERVEFLSKMNKPPLQVSRSLLQIGRAILTVSTYKGKGQSGRVFSQTGHAMRMLESIGTCVQQKEPVLLVGETGTGKTTLVQYLARQISMPLVVLNLSQQSDSVDLLGGYKPVEARNVCIPLFESFHTLFRETFPMKKNAYLLEQVGSLAERKKWGKLLKAFQTTVSTVAKLAGSSLSTSEDRPSKFSAISPQQEFENSVSEQLPKRKKPLSDRVLSGWRAFSVQLRKAERQVEYAKTGIAFSFVEGSLVKALKDGHWILLDEINLAPTETLERLTGLLEGEQGTLSLTERGDVDNIKWHPDFRIFACMNPATDVGKRDLPVSLKNRFTEFFVDELTNKQDLHAFVYQYLETVLPAPPVEDIVNFYLLARQEAEVKLLDGANQKPQYSLRSLARALEYTKAAMPVYGFQRSLYDGLCMSFLTLLDRPSSLIMEQLILGSIFKRTGVAGARWLKSILKVPSQPSSQHLLFEQFWIERGDIEQSGDSIDFCRRYVLTPSIREHLKNLSRAVFLRKNPVLLQGPTSSGKTSMIEYLALTTGHRFVRINNHEHTDLQEYLGSYVTDNTGKLVFQEGILVEAVRRGYWIVLDELNLAPSDVLEALNRLLDDNRELFVPELQEMVKPHPHFMLFATQNPPGIYGGRKVLSRAFRNRFIELHIDDIPDQELQSILEIRCQIPASYASKMVEVMKDLQRHRQSSRVFAGKHGFITPRDLFRWADRHANGYYQLARNGYMLLAERLREASEKLVVQRTLEKHMRVNIQVEELLEFSSSERLKEVSDSLSSAQNLSTLGKIVWTKSMRRLFNLVEQCIQHGEPVLLVGETGCGKTTVCQMLATLQHQKLHILNCHQHTETADFIGGLRPVRERESLAAKFGAIFIKLVSSSLYKKFYSEQPAPDIEDSLTSLETIRSNILHIKSVQESTRAQEGHSDRFHEIETLESMLEELVDTQRNWQSLFSWHDGPLVQAMRSGDFFLIDEISLADDSVLERLNSVLEPKRVLVLAEKGGSTVEEIVAHPNFRLLATMNPGGDFGKKELSPALRNRFTEIWVPSICDFEDLRSIVIDRLKQPELLAITDPLLHFWQWFGNVGEQGRALSVRDLLSWVSFINCTAEDIGLPAALVHGAHLVLLDGLGLGTGLSTSAAEEHRRRCLDHLLEHLPDVKSLCSSAFRHQFSFGTYLHVKCMILIMRHDTKAMDLVVQSLRVGLTATSAGTVARPLEIAALKNHIPDKSCFGIHPFYIPRGTYDYQNISFELSASTTSRNALRILRAMQLPKPVLLEGSPGVGKTSLVTAVAKSSGHKLIRINLSEQTDVMDLFGSDMPVEGGKSGEFCWSDGVFLQALKAGDWVLLDELNLAPQSVLEGLNACLDHRGEVFIPELGVVYKCPKSFRVFACQNPTSQGGGRKGLPKSFLNRFTKVYVDALGENDYLVIARALHPLIPEGLLEKMIRFNGRVFEDTMVAHAYAHSGSPWEFNLRDILRWCELIEGTDKIWSPEVLVGSFLDVIYLQRMRTKEDRDHLLSVYKDVFGAPPMMETYPLFRISPTCLHVGNASLQRKSGTQLQRDGFDQLKVLPRFANRLESLMHCVKRGWMCNLVGPAASGKTHTVRQLASLTGNSLHEFVLSSGTDTTDLLGCFEQSDPFRRWQDILRNSYQSMVAVCGCCLSDDGKTQSVDRKLNMVKSLLNSWSAFQRCLASRDGPSLSTSMNEEQVIVDPLAVNMLLQILEQVTLLWGSCGLPPLAAGLQPRQLASSLKSVQQTVAGDQKLGRFEWIDGGLLKAIEHGDWVLLENANLCNPTVLDRLNPLLEPDGTILINERGLVNGEAMLVRAHPNFRLFITVDPVFGEVSRAMRNRGVEIFMLEPDWFVSMLDQPLPGAESEDITSESSYRILAQSGIPGVTLVEAMFKAHTEVMTLSGSSRGGTNVSLRTLSHWISLLQQLLERGNRFVWSLRCSWVQTYMRPLSTEGAREAALRIFSLRLAQLSGVSRTDPCLWVPWGWPSPHNLSYFSIRSKESLVVFDSTYLEQLVSEYVAMKAREEWMGGLRGNSHIWLKNDMEIFSYLPPVILRKYLHPLASSDADVQGNVDADIRFRDLSVKLHHASLWMIEQGSLSDRGLRIMWLKRLAAKMGQFSQMLISLIQVLKQETDHVVGKELLAAWQKLEATVDGAFDLTVIPYASQSSVRIPVHTQHMVSFGTSRLDFGEVFFLGRKILILRRCLLQWQMEDDFFKSVSVQGASAASSPLLQSYLHHRHGSVRGAGVTQIPKTLLKYLYPLISSVRNLENEVLIGTGSDLWFTGVEVTLSTLLDWHEAVWKILRRPIFNMEEFLFCWVETRRVLLELTNAAFKIPRSRKVAESVKENVINLDGSFYRGSGFKPLLWKYGGHPQMLNSEALFEQEQLILAQCQNIWETPDEDDGNFIPYADVNLRRDIMEGLSMSVWLRQKRFCKKAKVVVEDNDRMNVFPSDLTLKAQRECAEIFELILQKINSVRSNAKTAALNSTASLGPRNTPDRVTICKCTGAHRRDDTVLRDLVRRPSARNLGLDLVRWIDHLSLQRDQVLLGNLSAASLSGLLESDLQEALRQGGVDAKALQSLLEFVITHSSRSPVDLVPHQQILWISEGMRARPTDVIVRFEDISHEMWFRWHRSLWRRSSKDLDLASDECILTNGPARMFLAANSVFLAKRIGHFSVPLKEYTEKMIQLRILISHLWDSQKYRYPDGLQLDILNLSSLFQQILLAHKKLFLPSDYVEMRRILKALHEQILKQPELTKNALLEELESVLQRAQHQGLLSITKSLIIPCAQLMFSRTWTNFDLSETLLEHGRLWLLVGSIRLHLLLPADDFDPVSKFSYKLAHAQDHLRNISLEVEARHRSELYLKGSESAPDVRNLRSRSREFTEKIMNLTMKIIYRPQPSKFRDFCKEVRRFRDLSGGKERLLSLWSKLNNIDKTSETDIGRYRHEVSAVQGNFERFIHIIERDFPAYRDFVQPVQQAVLELKFGLSLGLCGHLQRATVKSAGFQEADVTIANLISMLLEFPKLRSHRKGCDNERSTPVGPGCSGLLASDTERIVSWAALQLHSSSVTVEVAVMQIKVSLLRIVLLRVGHEIVVSGITSREILEKLESCFRAFSSIWQELREHRLERERKEAQVSEFTTTTYSMNVEETLDEETFRTMFPDYKSEFGVYSDPQLGDGAYEDDRLAEEVRETRNNLSRRDDHETEKEWMRMEEALVKDIIRIHNLLFSSYLESDHPLEVLDEDIVHGFLISYDTGKQLLQTLGHCIPASVDERLLPAHLMRYSLEYHQLAGGSVEYTSTGNKLTDANASEVANMLDPLRKYLDRVDQLLVDWPEHPVLLQISQLAKTLLSFPLDTAVMKCLTGLELLLAKSQLWEENAAKHVSLSGELSDLYGLVAHWRKMELEGWSSLLEKAEEKHTASANKLWFSLYGLLNRPVGDDLDAHLEATTASMEEFMQTSTLGEFRARLQLVGAFYGHLSAQTRAPGLSRHLTEAISNLLYNVFKYYSQFLPRVQENLSREKEVIEKELRDFVRLSKWDDRSYYTLSLSSEKAHRKLHRFVKKYVEILKRPVSELLTKQVSRMGSEALSDLRSQCDDSSSLDADDENHLFPKRRYDRESNKKDKLKVEMGLAADDWRKRCDIKMRRFSVVTAHVPEESGLYQKRLPVLSSKIADLLGASLFVNTINSCRDDGRDELDVLATAVIVRSAELRHGEKRIAQKKKALIDLLRVLRQVGLSHHKAAIPKEQRTTQSWLLLHPADVVSIASLKRSACGTPAPELHYLDSELIVDCSNLWKNAEDYYFKNMALVQQLQRLALDYNKDLSLREVYICKRYVEHLLYIQQRQRMKAHQLGLTLGQLGELRDVLSDCGKGLPKQKLTRKWLWRQKSFTDSLWQVATETMLVVKIAGKTQVCPENQMRLEAEAIKEFLGKLLEGLRSCRDRLDNHLVRRNCSYVLDEETFPMFCTYSMYEDVSGNFSVLSDLGATFKNVFQRQANHGANELICLHSVEQMLSEGFAMHQQFREEFHSFSTSNSSSASTVLLDQCSSFTEKAISEILLAVQTISKRSTQKSRTELNADEDSAGSVAVPVSRTIEDLDTLTLERTITPRLDLVYQALVQLLGSVDNYVDHCSGGPEICSSLGELLDLIHVPLDMLHCAGIYLLFSYISLHRSVTKLGYVLANVFISLFTEGFCKTKEGGDGEESLEDDVKGTGMGEGEGRKDVSEQIEDEEQLTGATEQENEAQNDTGGKKSEKGVEMDEDFAGEMLDLSDEVSEEDDESQDDENGKLESKMGDDGEDNEIVDEKLWNNDDENDRQPEAKEKYEKDSEVTGARPEDLQMRGKEGSNEEDAMNGEEPEEREKSNPEDVGEAQMEPDDEGAPDIDNTVEDSSGVKPRTEESLELPDGLELDGEENREDDLEPEQKENSEDGPKEAGNDVPDAMDIGDDMSGDQPASEDRDENDVETGEQESDEEGNLPMETEAGNEHLPEDAEPDEGDRAQESNQIEGLFQNDNAQEPSVEDAKNPHSDSRTSSKMSEMNNIIAGMTGNSRQVHSDETTLEESGATEASRQEEAKSAIEQPSHTATDGPDRTGTSSETNPASPQQNPDRTSINPYRSLGDAFKQWKERVRVADSCEQPMDVEQEPVSALEQELDGDEFQEYEFLINQDDKSVSQALGAATSDQLDEVMTQSRGREDVSSDDIMQDPQPDKTEERMDEELQGEKNQRIAKSNKSRLGQTKQEASKGSEMHLEDEIEKSISLLGLEDDLESAAKLDDSQVSLEPHRAAADGTLEPVGRDEIWSEEEINRIRKDLEVRLKDSDKNIEAARVIWRNYEHLTARLSQELAEQLRLILEPTLAAKLQGDYKSGKRINMKKVIPYIASQFRKDKIWLRRTKPNKRQYQVVVAIDDSRSMAESHCGHMALEALITICRAMSQAEIGQMAVVSFGEKGNVQLLHDFEDSFSSEAGVNMVSRFSFNQDNTIADKPVVDLLHFLTRMLDLAARKATAPAENLHLQQLVLIIADGRFHEKESLRRCIREAISRKQLLAFIVLDNPQESILDMQSVSFSSGAPSFTKYLDTFPFPYYILLRDIGSLPRTLADLLLVRADAAIVRLRRKES
ncbi:hypothetical protein R1sor_016892 [Riccia sorocarpa]|uniref:Midasin n=1 Tax=Riccia sorocarpa TaxID=122646 RepID=A0ABD3HGR2_9MARC